MLSLHVWNFYPNCGNVLMLPCVDARPSSDAHCQGAWGGRALPSEVSRSQGCLRTHIGMLRMLFPGNPSHCDTNLHWARWDGQQGPRVSKGRGPRDLEKAAFFASGHMEQHFLGPEETPGAVLNRASLWPPLPGGNEMLFGGEQAPLSPPQL